jgi:hypothetical protein
MNTQVLQAIRALKSIDMQSIQEIAQCLANQIEKLPNSHLATHKNAIEMLDDLVLYLFDEIKAEEAYGASQDEEDARLAA